MSGCAAGGLIYSSTVRVPLKKRCVLRHGKFGLPIFDLGAAKLTRGVCFLVKLVLVYDII